MSDRLREARITAISLTHAGAIGTLLRAHGCGREADDLDAALRQAFGIMAARLGAETLSEALRWAREDGAGEQGRTGAPPAAPDKAH